MRRLRIGEQFVVGVLPKEESFGEAGFCPAVAEQLFRLSHLLFACSHGRFLGGRPVFLTVTIIASWHRRDEAAPDRRKNLSSRLIQLDNLDRIPILISAAFGSAGGPLPTGTSQAIRPEQEDATMTTQ